MLRVTEIFRSIQGESTHAGRPCTFVRLTGCPMRCTWCDSEYTFTGGEHLSIEEIMKQVRDFDCRLVEVTHGRRPVKPRPRRDPAVWFEPLHRSGNRLRRRARRRRRRQRRLDARILQIQESTEEGES